MRLTSQDSGMNGRQGWMKWSGLHATKIPKTKSNWKCFLIRLNLAGVSLL